MEKRRVTARGLLKLISDVGEFVLPLDKMAPYRWIREGGPIKDLDEYFPSVAKLVADRLERRGLVEKIETAEGWVIKITDKGKKETLKFRLADLQPKSGKWDGKWRMVFFDIAEIERGKRDRLRMYLRQLGMKQMQESVFVNPYNVFDEVKYLREVLDVPHGVKLAELSWVENGKELKEIFGVS